VVERVEGDHIWIKANGAGDAPVGWAGGNDARLLENAIPYFTSRIDHDPKDWDAYLRPAEAEHSSNQREAAIVDYTRAIELHPNKPFLFLRRGRAFRIIKDCLGQHRTLKKRSVLAPDGLRRTTWKPTLT
jgi:hypothetical protein